MNKTLYVTNFGPEVSDEQLRALFSQYGEVVSVQPGTAEGSQAPYALVEMNSEKNATRAMHGLNGHDLGGFHLAISPPDLDLTREMTSKQQKSADAIAAALEETVAKPVRQIQAMVRFCGSSFAEAILKEALEIAAQDGIMTGDGTRPRTKGGVFFYLARYRMAAPIRHLIYTRHGKLPKPKEDQEVQA